MRFVQTLKKFLLTRCRQKANRSPELERAEREEVEALREDTWHLQQWEPGPALVDPKGGSSRKYYGQYYDPYHFRYEPGGWTHDHCMFCWATITNCEINQEGIYNKAYTNGLGDWLCPDCYEALIQSREDAIIVLDRWERTGETKPGQS